MSVETRVKRQSLRVRLALAGGVSLVFALVIAFFGLSLIFERQVERRVAAELRLQLEQLIGALNQNAGKLVLDRELADPRFLQPLSGLYWQIRSGEEVLRSRSLWDATLELPPQEPGAPVSRTIPGPENTQLLVIEREIVASRRLNHRRVQLAVAIIRTDIETATAEFRREMLPYLILLGALFIAGTVFQITIGLRPLRALRSKIAEIRQGSAHRMGDDFPAEILPLTRELDELVASRELQIRRAREHAADFAHGLKTPLQALTGDIDRLRARGETALADDIQSLAAIMRRHVDHQLARARIAGRAVGRCDVNAVVYRIAGVLERTPKGGLLDWQIDEQDGIAARIDAEDLTELLGNILENAVRYAESRIEISAIRDGRDILIAIRDDGHGIPNDKIAHVLERGGRLDESSGGAGLGLAIARDIATAVEGSIALDNADPGLRVTIRLGAAG